MYYPIRKIFLIEDETKKEERERERERAYNKVSPQDIKLNVGKTITYKPLEATIFSPKNSTVNIRNKSDLYKSKLSMKCCNPTRLWTRYTLGLY